MGRGLPRFVESLAVHPDVKLVCGLGVDVYGSSEISVYCAAATACRLKIS